MKCPYCGNEMEQGIIQSPHEISWRKEASWLNTSKFQKGSVVLSAFSLFKGSKAIAYLCRSCEKIVVDCAYSKCDANYNK